MEEGDEDFLGSAHKKSRQVMGSDPPKATWFDFRVFYVTLSCCPGSAPEYLTLRLHANSKDAVELNGGRIILPSPELKNNRGNDFCDNFFSIRLLRNRVDKECEEATFVSTDNIRTTGSLQFQVCDNEDVVLICGSLENIEGGGDGSNNARVWEMDCRSAVAGPGNCGFLRGMNFVSPPAVEVYVAGSFAGSPVVLSKVLHLICRKRIVRRRTLDVIPENEITERIMDSNLHCDQLPEDRDYEECDEKDEESLRSFYSRGAYVECDDGELSWFNAGIRVGVGIGLGMCLGIGIGIGLLVRTYQSTTRNFKKRLL